MEASRWPIASQRRRCVIACLLMALPTKSKQIGENTYSVTAFGAKQGRVIFARLTNLLGPLVRSFKSIADDVAEGKDVDKGNVIIDAIAEACSTLPPKEFASLCDEFATYTEVTRPDGTAPRLDNIFDIHFAANYMEMILWFTFVLEVNFKDFFTGPLIAQLLATATKKPESPPKR